MEKIIVAKFGVFLFFFFKVDLGIPLHNLFNGKVGV